MKLALYLPNFRNKVTVKEHEDLTALAGWIGIQDVPVAKTLDDLKRLKEEIMPKVDAM